jgi:Dyp-type peroxidase family
MMERSMRDNPFVGPAEPVLELDDIQGAAVPGFLKPFQTLIGVQCSAGKEASFRRLVGGLSPHVSDARLTLRDRRDHRASQRGNLAKQPIALTGLAFSFQGLVKLTPGTASFESEAFRIGMLSRSELLGDPTDDSDEGHPSHWKVGGPEQELDALILVAGDTRECVESGTQDVLKELDAVGLQATWQEPGAVRQDQNNGVSFKGHEHFGFNDGVSQPGIRGLASKDDPTDFITDRHLSPDDLPAYWLNGYPGQTLLWPGEFLLGHPTSSVDPMLPGRITPANPPWTRNGSFLVFRRLRQDVRLFWHFMHSEAARLAHEAGFRGITAERFASMLVGRWPSGAPFNRTPEYDIPDLGKNQMFNNYFRFDSNTLPLKGISDPYPMAKADPAGTSCPLAAHIRKVNTRDSASDTGSQDSTYKRRLLRVGIPFGKPLALPFAPAGDDPENGERGLLFLSVQASIEDQFEFLCARWANDPSRPKMPGGHDFIIGQNGAPDGQRVRRCIMFGSDLKESHLSTTRRWVIPTGGGYFFLPSKSALNKVLSS